MTIEIPTAYQPFVQSMIDSGHYNSEMEVIGAALSLLSQSHCSSEQLFEKLRPAIEEVDRNEGTEIAYEDIGDYVRQLYHEAITENRTKQ